MRATWILLDVTAIETFRLPEHASQMTTLFFNTEEKEIK
jgi:hypothetical protein